MALKVRPGSTGERWLIHRGTVFRPPALLVLDQEGRARDLTGATARLLIGPSLYREPTFEALVGTGLEIVDAPNGEIQLDLSAVQAASLPVGAFTYELTVTDASGAVILQIKGQGEVLRTLKDNLDEGVIAAGPDGFAGLVGERPAVSGAVSETEAILTRDPARTPAADVVGLRPLKALLDAKADVAGMTSALALKAPLVSPAFTGSPTAPTPATSDNSARIATMAAVQAVVAALVNSSPAALDTLNELATALGNDPNFATSMIASLATKQDSTLPANTLGEGSAARNISDLLGKSLRNKRLIPPDPLLGTLPFNVLTSGNGDYYTDFDWGNFVTGQIMYINRAIGNNSNDGLTPITPKQSLAAAINAGARIIYVTGTVPYTNTHCLWDTIVWPDADIAIVGLGPRPQFVCGDIPSVWTAVPGHANCYFATVSNPINVVDLATLDSRGNPTPLTVRTDQTALDGAADGFFTSGSTVVVKLTDLTQPSSTRLAVTRSSRLIPKHAVAGRSVYLQNIAIISDRPFWIDSPDSTATDFAKKLVTVDCLFGYVRNNDAFLAQHIGLCASYRSTVCYSDGDCFNYNGSIGTTSADQRMLVLEEQCVGYRSGWNGGAGGPNQCSTAHEGCRVVRVVSPHGDAGGPIIQDQADLTHPCAAWVVGCVLVGSRASQGSGYSIGIYGVGYNTYIFDCTVSGTYGDIETAGRVDRCRVTTMQGNRCGAYRQEFE